MKSLSVQECGELTRAFDAEDAEAALARGLAALEVLGIAGRVASAEDTLGEGWLTLEQGGRRYLFVDHGAHDQASKLFVEHLVRLCLSRVADADALRQSRERAEMLSSASFEGLMIHVDGNVIDANQRLAELLGCQREEVLGTRTLTRCVAQEDLPRVFQYMASGYEGAYVITGVRMDGTRFRAELQAKQGKLGTRPVRVAAVRDVTERERMLELIRESEARLRTLCDAAFEVTVLSRDGVILEARGDVERVFGYTPESIVGREVLTFVAPTRREQAREILEQGRTAVYDTVALDAVGASRPVQVFGVNATLDGKAVRLTGLRDLTETRRLEAERRRVEQQLERSQRLDSLGVLAGGIAHDFNNLLVGILGNADLLVAATTDATHAELAEAIVDAARNAAGLTAQLLAYAGRANAAEREPIELKPLVERLHTLLSARMAKGVKLRSQIEPGCVVLADPTQLTQVLMNLLTNASDALLDGKGEITVRARPLYQPGAEWDGALGATVGPGNWLLLEVEDDGIGMDEATLARIFEPFFSSKVHGHGLGLAACLGNVKAIGGALRVESEPGRGSRFSVLLPAAAGFEARRPEAAPDTQSPCRVLIVDDERVVRSQLRRSLELRGFSVIEADGGEAGLAALAQHPVDLMIVDLTMGALGGADVIAEARRRGFDLPIVLTSGYLGAEVEQRLAPDSFQAFLSKPYGIAELMAAIVRARQALGRA